jgi:hypothetical protein
MRSAEGSGQNLPRAVSECIMAPMGSVCVTSETLEKSNPRLAPYSVVQVVRIVSPETKRIVKKNGWALERIPHSVGYCVM